VSDQRQGPRRAEPRDERELEDGGPALRITERRHAGGPAMNVYTGWGVPDIEGPAEDGPASDLPARRPAVRGDALLGGLGIAVLLLAAAASFWTSGNDRADGTLQALGIAFLVLAALAAAIGVYLSRRA
jgi:hypothetical protein